MILAFGESEQMGMFSSETEFHLPNPKVQEQEISGSHLIWFTSLLLVQWSGD